MLFPYRFGSPKSSPQRSPAKPKPKEPIRNRKRNRELLSLPRQSDAPKEKERKVAVTETIQNLIDLNQTSQNVTAEKTSSEKQQPPAERPNSNSKTAEAAAKATSSSSRSDDQMEASTSKIPPAETVHVEQPGRDHPPPPGQEEEQQQQTSHEEMPDKESPGTTRSFLDSTPSLKGLSDISDDTLPPNDQLKGLVSELSADLSDVTLPDDSNTQSKAGFSDISDGDLPPDDSNIPTRRTSAALSEMSDGNLALCEMVIGREDDEHELLEDGELHDETLVPNETSHEDSAKTKETTDTATDRSSVVLAQKSSYSEENKTEAEIRIGMEDEEIDTEDMELEDGELPTTSQATPNDDNNTRSEQPMVKDINMDEMTKIKSK